MPPHDVAGPVLPVRPVSRRVMTGPELPCAAVLRDRKEAGGSSGVPPPDVAGPGRVETEPVCPVSRRVQRRWNPRDAFVLRDRIEAVSEKVPLGKESRSRCDAGNRTGADGGSPWRRMCGNVEAALEEALPLR